MHAKHRSCAAVVLAMLCSAPAGAQAGPLPPLPDGATLPVVLQHKLDAHHARPGQPLEARLSQRVPLPGGTFLPEGAKVTGRVLAYDGRTLSLRFTQLEVKGRTEPMHARLLAVADWFNVDESQDRLGAPSRGDLNDPSQWTTRQVGGDVVYRVNGAGRVYSRYSDSVGNADSRGVYADPREPGGLERSMGPFSTTAAGLYGVRDLVLLPGASGAPITFKVESPDWELRAHDALLLVIAP